MPPEFESWLVRGSSVDLVAKQIKQLFCSQSKNVIRRQRRAGAVATLTRGDFNVKPRGGVSRSSAMRWRTDADSDDYLFPIVGEQIRIRETFLRGQVASAPPRSHSLPYKAREIGHFGPRPKSRIADRKEAEGARARRRWRWRWRRLGS